MVVSETTNRTKRGQTAHPVRGIGAPLIVPSAPEIPAKRSGTAMKGSDRKMTTKKTDKPESILLEEFRNSLSHIRHLETTRSRYLSFFFAALLWTLGLMISVYSDLPSQSSQPFDDILIFASLVMLWIMGVFSSVIYTSFKKLRFAMALHMHKVHWIRDRIYSDTGYSHDDLLGPFGAEHPFRKSALFNVQKIAEHIVLVSGFLIDAVFIYGAILAAVNKLVPCWLVVVSSVVLLVPLVCLQIYAKSKKPEYANPRK
jgi:hypothetical protein